MKERGEKQKKGQKKENEEETNGWGEKERGCKKKEREWKREEVLLCS